MIDLALVGLWLRRLLVVALFVLWRRAEHKESAALEVARGTVQTATACVTGFQGFADSIGAAVRGLHPAAPIVIEAAPLKLGTTL